jgi:predicted nucleotidyltransferase
MSDISLNISGKIELPIVKLYQNVSEVSAALEIPFIVVGASARDIVLHYGHGASVERATQDIDFGIEVPDWSAFQKLKQSLADRGFQEAATAHRMMSPNNIPSDIVPFGDIEDEQSSIAWPPAGDRKMSVLGFQEVCANAEIVRIQEDPPVDIPVASPAGMTILKLIAWLDRVIELRGRDATDLAYLLANYEKLPQVSEHLYRDQKLMEQHGWDLTLASAHQLGADAGELAGSASYALIANFFKGEHDKLNTEKLLGEMGKSNTASYERHEALLNACIEGFIAIHKY